MNNICNPHNPIHNEIAQDALVRIQDILEAGVGESSARLINSINDVLADVKKEVATI
jgi:hypothetical protein